MRYDFDTPINRRNTFSFKWDCDMDYFGRDDVIPMWVADMDFACAPCIVEAVQKRAAHPVYGYGVRLERDAAHPHQARRQGHGTHAQLRPAV